MEIRTFEREDAGEVVSLWNASLKADKADSPWYLEGMLLSEDRLGGIVSSPNFDPAGAYVARDGSQIVGFGRGVVKKAASYEGEDLKGLPGYLEGLVVNPAFRGRGIGAHLLQRIESYVRASGKDTITMTRYRSAVAGVFVLPDTPEYRFLLNRGYQVSSREMRLRLTFERFSLSGEIAETRARLSREGIEIRYYEDRHRDSFSRLMEGHFQGWWHYSYKPNLESASPRPVLIAVNQDRVVGFIGFVAVDRNRRAGFSPGVDPEYRKRSIGKALVHLWAEAVKQLGAEESFISVGVNNLPAKSIYLNMGYKSVGEFCPVLTKKL